MQRRARFGELLSRLVPLSGHDIEEILQEQTANRRKFGDIALSWGLCKPEHVWDAWAQQTAQASDLIDLEKVGVDAQAAALLHADIARRLNVLPVRAATDIVIIATCDATPDHMGDALNELLRRRVKFIQVEREQLARLMEAYYPQARS